MATLGVQPLYVKTGEVLNFIVSMASKLLSTTSLEKLPQDDGKL
jgi:hypothetical protein